MKTTPSQFTAPVIFAALAALAPSIAFGVKWEHDTDAKWDIQDPSLDQDDFQAWESTVSARTIVGGKELTGEAYLCGSWLPFGDDPAETYAEIGGYLLQKLDEANADLYRQLKGPIADDLITQTERVRAYLKDTMRAEYDAQRAAS